MLTICSAVQAAGVQRKPRSPGLLGGWAQRLIALVVVTFGVFAAPARAGVAYRVIDEPRRVSIRLETDLLAYDVCWSDNAEAARQRVADLAIAQVDAAGSRSVLSFPQLSTTWAPLGSSRLVKDLLGRPVDRTRVNRGKGTYTTDIETALLDILSRVHRSKPGVLLSVNGFKPQVMGRATAFAELRKAVDFVYVDEDLFTHLRRADQRRDLASQVASQTDWLIASGMSDTKTLVVRCSDKWIEVSKNPFDEPATTGAEESAAAPSALAAGDAAGTDASTPPSVPAPTPEATRPAPPTQRAAAPAANPDLNSDGVVNGDDRAMLVAAWNTNDSHCDLNGDGVVNSSDLAMLLGAFTPQAQSQVQGAFIPNQAYYLRGSGADLGFNITAGAPAGVNIVFQVQPLETNQPPTVQWDGAAPFTIPWHLLNNVSLGRAQVQAMVRDRNFNVVATITKNITFVDTAPTDTNQTVSTDPPAPPPPAPSSPPAASPPAGDNAPPSQPADPPAATGALPCGINLAPLAYYTREWVFTDIFKIAMPWLTQNNHYVGDGSDAWSTGQIDKISFDQNGYPLSLPVTVPGKSAPQIVVTLMYRDSQGHYPGGNYVCLYDGQGKIDFAFDAAVVSQTQTATGGRMVVRVTPSDAGVLLKVLESNAANHIRNIRFIAPGFEDVYTTQQFHPMFLDRIRPFKVLRFMDWMRTNDSNNKDWANRTTGTWFSQGDDRGVSVETMVALANASGIDPWFCIPHQATDDYIRQFATLVKATLNPDRKVYLEYSNEVWNGQFQQYHWMIAHGDQSLRDFPQKYAALAGHMFDIWRQVYGADSGKLVRTCMGQHLNPWVLETAMTQLNGNVDAAGCAAYFGPATPPTPFTSATTAADLIPLCRQWIRDECLPKLRANKAIAQRWNVPFITYEGGQHMTGYGHQDLPELQALINVQYHPQIYDCYMDLVRGLRDMDCKMFTAFNFTSSRSQWGSWGHLEFQDQNPANTPKYRALQDAAAGQIPAAQ